MPVYQDSILRVGEDGSVRQRIHVLDVLYSNGLAWHLAEEDVLANDDPTHLNDVEPLPADLADGYPLFGPGDLLVSLRNLDLIFVLDPGTLKVRWHASGPFILQHDPDFLGDGRTVWEWIVEPYGDAKVPPVADAVRVPLTRDDVAAWPCAAPGGAGGGGGAGARAAGAP